MNLKKILTTIAQLPLDGDEVGVKKDDGSVDFVEKDKAEDLEKCDEDLEEDFDDFPRDVEMVNPVDDFEMGTDEYGLQQLEGNITGRVSELKNLLKRYIQTCNKIDVLDDHSRSCQNEFMDLLGKLNDTVVFESELNPGSKIVYGIGTSSGIKIKNSKIQKVDGNKIYLDSSAILNKTDRVKQKSDIKHHHDFYISESVNENIKSEINPKELWKNDLEKFYNFVYKDKD